MGAREPTGAYADERLCQEERNRGLYEPERGERGGVGDVGGRIEGEWSGGLEDGIVSFASFLSSFSSLLFLVWLIATCDTFAAIELTIRISHRDHLHVMLFRG